MKKRILILSCITLLLAGLLAAWQLWRPWELRPSAPPTAESAPPYIGNPWVTLGDGRPTFTEEELAGEEALVLSPLDELDRRGPALARLGPETLPTQPRGPIGQVKPSGWHTIRYDFIDGKYLYNRCHLIAYQLSGVNSEPLNLITGTRYLNTRGMLPIENRVADYIRRTGNHVLYRATPIYRGEDLLCSGVELEALSVEDGGKGISLRLYVYNVQPGVVIDYATGESSPDPDWAEAPEETPPEPTLDPDTDYIVNLRTGKFHLPGCSGAASLKPSNRQGFTGDRQDLLNLGFSPCGTCKP